MKHGRNPTRAQKVKIKTMGLNYENWLVIRDDAKAFIIEHRHTGNIRKKYFKEGE